MYIAHVVRAGLNLPFQSPLFLGELHDLAVDEETFAFSDAVHVRFSDVFSVGFLP
jgi:hypothetical protein